MCDTQPQAISRTVQPLHAVAQFNRSMTRLGELLRLYRAVHGQSVRQCADEIGVHFSSLARFERTNTGMSADHLLKIMQWLMSQAPKGRGADS